MRFIRTAGKMREFSHARRLGGETIGFIPTMGALHAGHISLIRQARRDNDTVVVSIFVNPAQFSPQEDYLRYPRNIKKDAALCLRESVDVLFCPSVKQMYPAGYNTYVEVKDLSGVLCGRFRPGHFRGVATVVAKLLNIITPDIAYLGRKDAQQALIIQRMVADLNMPVEIRIMPTLREKEGLAMSSRNAYLSCEERKNAAVIYQALKSARGLIKRGERDAQAIINKIRKIISGKARIQYVSITDDRTLIPLKRIDGPALVAIAAWVGKTRLIDNITVKR
ncbi:MAG: pantoate--beta-alanine ligase [Candidatus Omnitrophota bacterium]